MNPSIAGFLDGYMYKQSDEDLVSTILSLAKKYRPELLDPAAGQKTFETMTDEAWPHVKWGFPPKVDPEYSKAQALKYQQDPQDLIRMLNYYNAQPLKKDVRKNPYSAIGSPVRWKTFGSFPDLVIKPGMEYFRANPNAMADLETKLRGTPLPASAGPAVVKK